MRKAAKTDANQNRLRDYAVNTLGVSWQSLGQVGHGCPDVMLGFVCPGCRCPVNLLVEIKDGSLPPSARKLNEQQERWRLKWGGQYAVVTCERELAELVRHPHE